ncbi:hypothetical protein BH09ACT10_BH09ACT10_08870 [soil metagenome]
MSSEIRDASARNFTDYSLPNSLVAALAKQGITIPSPVQQAVIPDALAGKNVLGRARTGSGKTLAFGIPILVKLAGGTSRPKSPRGLIILPTRELANQVREALEPLALGLNLKLATVYGGTSYDKQIKRLRAGVDIVVATPGRLTDLIDRGACRLDDIEVLVLDEADHLCDLGFYKPIDALLSKTPAQGQRLLLSATLDGDVNRLVKRHLPVHVLHELDPSEGQPSTMEHHVLVSAPTEKGATTRALLVANPRSIVFTRTRRGASNLARTLTKAGVEAVDLHGDLSQRNRERNLKRFSDGDATVVVATDVAARGIHVDNVGLVVHYDLPAEPKAYLHRSGRTARAGESGAVVTMATSQDVGDVVRLQQKAGVEARHHDARTAPSLTVEALSGAGTAAPVVGPGSGKSSGGGRGRPGGGSGGGRRQGAPTGGYARPRNAGGAQARRSGGGGPRRPRQEQR